MTTQGSSQVDLLVIGSGLSGLMAATMAAARGVRVKVIAKGMGATHWHAGTVDVLGYDGAGRPVHRPFDSLAELDPAHPYRLVGAAGVRAALEAFAGLPPVQALGYAPGDDTGRNMWLPSPVGAARPAYLAPAGQRAGDLARAMPLLIVGIAGLRDFYPKLIAENLTRQGWPARSATLPLSLFTERRDVNTVQLAQRVEQPARLERLAAALSNLVEPGERIGLPAILGLDDHRRVLARLEEAANAPVFEIPTLPPSVPGIRLHQGLRRHLESLGVAVEVGMEAIGFHAEKGRIAWVETETSSRPLKHRARAFLLATGGVLGGGFASDHTGRFWETLFHLPLTVEQDRSRWFRPEFLDPAGHPVFRAGVPVDGAWQPVDGQGNRVYENLWAAGGLLDGCDPLRERSLEGIALTTATAAAGQIEIERGSGWNADGAD